VVTVPADAVQRGAQGMYAYVVKPDSTVAVQPLKVGSITGAVAVIESGIDEGQPVVTAGQYRLQPGAKVEVRTAVAQRPMAAETPPADSGGRSP
jgi:multidrug efflux system membrane fusion protein